MIWQPRPGYRLRYGAHPASSRFEKVELRTFLPDVEPDPNTRKRLEALHPGRMRFAAMGTLAIREKTGQRAG
jgi:hypothetical protein